MTMHRRPGFTRGLTRAVAAAAFALSLAACTDGYPTEDVPQIEPSRMTQTQLLAALNALGKEPHLGKRWRYEMHANCELEVSVRGGGTVRRRIVLEGAQVTTRTVDGVSQIQLQPKADGESQALTVLETRRWFDAVAARSLLTHLEVRCGSPVPPTA